jgi:hypothetical protein
MKQFNPAYGIFMAQNEIAKQHRAEMPSDTLYWKSCKDGMPEEGALILIYVDGDEQVFPAKSITNTGECYTFGSLVRLHENDFYAYMPNPPENR